MRRFTVISSFTAAGVAVSALAACGSSANPVSSTTSKAASAASSAAASATGSTTSITVFAAASLQGAFTQIGKQFEAAHPGARVTFSFGPSSGLATQIINGAPASVFASAAPANMTQVVKAGETLNSPSNFAKNKMEVAVPPGNPGHASCGGSAVGGWRGWVSRGPAADGYSLVWVVGDVGSRVGPR